VEFGTPNVATAVRIPTTMVMVCDHDAGRMSAKPGAYSFQIISSEPARATMAFQYALILFMCDSFSRGCACLTAMRRIKIEMVRLVTIGQGWLAMMAAARSIPPQMMPTMTVAQPSSQVVTI
jgi:hypothetical protein